MRDVQAMGTPVCSVVSVRKYGATCVTIHVDVSLVYHLFSVDLVLPKSFSKSLSLYVVDPVVLRLFLPSFNERGWPFTTIQQVIDFIIMRGSGNRN